MLPALPLEPWRKIFELGTIQPKVRLYSLSYSIGIPKSVDVEDTGPHKSVIRYSFSSTTARISRSRRFASSWIFAPRAR